MSLHHYVPQFHQKLFRPDRRKGLIWSYDKRFARTRLTSIRKSMAIDDYYAIPQPTGEPDNAVEDMLAGLEGQAARVIKVLLKLGDDRYRLSENDRTALALYLGTLYLRGPARRGASDAIATLTARMLLDMAIAREDWIEEALAQGLSDNREELKQAKEDWEAGRIIVEAPASMSLQNLSVGINAVTPILLGRRWYIFRTPGWPHLILGDQPVVIPRPEPGLRGVGPATPGAEITCPLDPTHLLVIEDAPDDGFLTIRTLPHPPDRIAQATWVQVVNDTSWREARFSVVAKSQADIEYMRMAIPPDIQNRYPQLQVSGLPERWARLLPPDVVARRSGPGTQPEDE